MATTNIIKVPVDITTIKKIEVFNHYQAKLETTALLIHKDAIHISSIEGVNTYVFNFNSNNKETFLKYFEQINKENTVSYTINTFGKETSSKDIDFDSNKDYTYGHIDIPFKCIHCGEQSLLSQLSDYCSDDDQTYEIDICPHCETPNCVNYEYQKLTDKQCEQILLNKTI